MRTRPRDGEPGGVVAVRVEEGTRRHFWNGVRASQLETRRRLPAVFLTGADLSRLSGPPSARRRALDRISFSLEPRHVRDLAEYEKARGSKGRLLASPRSPDPDEIAAWDDAMAAAAGRVAASRRRALSVLALALRREAARLGSPWESLLLSLESDLPATGDAATLEKAFREAARERGAEERRAGRCLVGPHRDDVAATWEGVPVSERISSGENRTLVLAWTLAEAAILTETAAGEGRPPLFAFDDFDSEWDPGILDTFARTLGEEAQVLLTSARPDSLRGLPLPGGWLFRMEKGKLRHEGILGAGRAARSAEPSDRPLQSGQLGQLGQLVQLVQSEQSVQLVQLVQSLESVPPIPSVPSLQALLPDPIQQVGQVAR